jgi:hypothetical protein
VIRPAGCPTVPLLALLKNEALRPRHWARLMDLTGVKFELGDFTLGKLFAMVRVFISIHLILRGNMWGRNPAKFVCLFFSCHIPLTR